jgi:hypothetical protein
LTVDKTNWNRRTNDTAAQTKTTTMTFRIYEQLLRKLRKDAQDHGVSLNILVNQILTRYVEWDSYEPKVGMIPVAKPVLIQLFENISEEKIVEIATNVGRSAVKDIALFMKHQINIESFLQWFETRMKTSSVEISHQRLNNNNSKIHSYIIKHDLGKNWSVFHKTIFESILQDVLGKPLKNVSASSTMLRFEFEE